MMSETLISIKETANILKISKGDVYDLIKEGKLSYQRKNKRIFVVEEQVKSLKKKGEQKWRWLFWGIKYLKRRIKSLLRHWKLLFGIIVPLIMLWMGQRSAQTCR